MDETLEDAIFGYVRSAWASYSFITWRHADGDPLLNPERLASALNAPVDDVRTAVDRLVERYLLRWNDDPENGSWLRPKIDEN